MKPFRKNLALAIDGGGIRGVIVTQALSVLEDHLGSPLHQIARLAVGTSTGSTISAGIGAGLSAKRMTNLYKELGSAIFPTTLRKMLFPLTRYRYPVEPFQSALADQLEISDGSICHTRKPLIRDHTYDLAENRTRFIKPGRKTIRIGWCRKLSYPRAPSPHISHLSKIVLSTAAWVPMPIPATLQPMKPKNAWDGSS